jgi:hypothetical protein
MVYEQNIGPQKEHPMETDAQQASYTGQQSDRFTAPPEAVSTEPTRARYLRV